MENRLIIMIIDGVMEESSEWHQVPPSSILLSNHSFYADTYVEIYYSRPLAVVYTPWAVVPAVLFRRSAGCMPIDYLAIQRLFTIAFSMCGPVVRRVRVW